jgi:iron complex transport system substrate-binding protein
MTACQVLTLGLWVLLGTASAQARTIPDMLGRPVTIPDGPLRLVSLSPSLTEIVYALGREDWLVGVTDFCDYPPAARGKPRVGGTISPNLERVLQVRPSLVLATAEGNPRDLVGQLTRVGIPIFALKPDGYAGILDAIRLLGRLLQAEAPAAALVRAMDEQASRIQRAVAGRPRPRVLYLVWSDPAIAAGPASFIHDLIRIAGGENVVTERTVPYPRVSLEEVVARAPEVILVARHLEAMDRPAVITLDAAWQAIPAVRSDRLVPVPGDTIHRFGPRVVEGLGHIAKAIHPEAFGQAERP